MTPQLSVALPVYDTKQEHLKEAIESILTQSFTDFECIIYNDASTVDYIDNVVASYNDPRIRYYKSDKNQGISVTRNAIIEFARGRYIAVADHDDISLPQRFEKQVAFLDRYSYIGVVGSFVESFPHKHLWFCPEYDIDIRASLFRSCSILHPSTMMRRSLLMEHNIRYEEDFTPAEDYMLWCRLMQYTQFYNLQEVLLLYRFHENNTSKVQKKEMSQASEHIRSIMKTTLPEQYTMALVKQECEKSRVRVIRLFGFVPLLRRKKKGRYIYWYLFYYIPLFRYTL